MRVILTISAALLIAAGCASRPLTPELRDVKMSRENPDSKCVEIGRVTGTTQKINGTPEEVLQDMQDDAAHKGANYVRVEQYSAQGTSVTGIAYRCP